MIENMNVCASLCGCLIKATEASSATLDSIHMIQYAPTRPLDVQLSACVANNPEPMST